MAAPSRSSVGRTGRALPVPLTCERARREPRTDTDNHRLSDQPRFVQTPSRSRPPRHWHAPMPAHMMSRIDRPIDEILGADPTDGPPAAAMNCGAGVREPGETDE